MPYLLLLSALFCNVFLAITDKQSSGYINSRQIVFFSFHKTILCAFFALFLLPFENFQINIAGILISVFAGIFHCASVISIMRCLKSCDAVFVNIIMSAGIIVPSLLGWVILDDTVNLFKIFCLVFLIFSLACILNLKKGGRLKAGLLSLLFVCYGMLMVMQKLFPIYSPEGSKALFSVIMYSVSAIILAVFLRKEIRTKPNYQKPLKAFLLLAAILNLVINILLPTVSAWFEASVTFPVVHGAKLVIITLISPFLWKEKLSLVQIIFCFVAIACICGLSI